MIGNSKYEAVSPLENPKNDSEDIAEALKQLGFEVLLHQDLNYEGMRRALREFSRKSIGAERAMLFYAGHGIEVEGTNYLIPTDAQLRNDLDVQYEAIPLDSGLTAVEGANELRLVILDACRNNPFVNKIKRTSATRSIGRGLWARLWALQRRKAQRRMTATAATALTRQPFWRTSKSPVWS